MADIDPERTLPEKAVGPRILDMCLYLPDKRADTLVQS